MNPNLENIIKNVNALPLPDREEFFDWAEEERRKSTKEIKLNDEQNKFRLAMKWLDENREKYLGQWVCLDGDRLIAHGSDAVKIYRDAREKGIEVPFVEHITEENENYGGGIELCP
jgi:hypothetical protein